MLTVDEILKVVSDYFRIDPAVVKEIGRKGAWVKAKHITMYFARKMFNYSDDFIRTFFSGAGGYINRTSIIHAVKSVSNQCESNRFYRDQVAEIEGKLKELMGEPVDEEVFMEPDFFVNSEN